MTDASLHHADGRSRADRQDMHGRDMTPLGVQMRSTTATAGPTRASKRNARVATLRVGMVLAVLACGRVFVLEPYHIPSESMTPALTEGDMLLVNKLAYSSWLPASTAGQRQSTVSRGDIVVFDAPSSSAQTATAGNISDAPSSMVKRIVGLPGDTVMMRDGLLGINGVDMPQGDVARRNPKGYPDARDPRFAWQYQHVVTASRFGSPPDIPSLDSWGPLVVPAGSYFVLGDNRYRSIDSRHYGVITASQIRGRAALIHFSYRPGERPFNVATAVRWHRLGRWVR